MSDYVERIQGPMAEIMSIRCALCGVYVPTGFVVFYDAINEATGNIETVPVCDDCIAHRNTDAIMDERGEADGT